MLSHIKLKFVILEFLFIHCNCAWNYEPEIFLKHHCWFQILTVFYPILESWKCPFLIIQTTCARLQLFFGNGQNSFSCNISWFFGLECLRLHNRDQWSLISIDFEVLEINSILPLSSCWLFSGCVMNCPPPWTESPKSMITLDDATCAT